MDKQPISTYFLDRCLMCGGRVVDNEFSNSVRLHSPRDNDYPYADDACLRPRHKLGEWE